MIMKLNGNFLLMEKPDHFGLTIPSGFTSQAFTGSGNRLDGKKKGIEPSPAPIDPSDIKRYCFPLTLTCHNLKCAFNIS